MTTAKKLEKKFILAANFPDAEDEKLQKEIAMAKAEADNPTYVPGLNPSAATVQGYIAVINDPNTGLIVERDAAKALEKSLTEKINKKINDIQDIITRQWTPQAEAALKNDPDKVSKAKTLQFGVKALDTGHVTIAAALDKQIILSSHPVIVKVDVNTHDLHTLHIHNNLTGKRKLPAGMSRIDIYGYTGAAGLVIADLAALIALGGGYLGEAKRGKFVNTFTANTGKTEYYVAVYVDKKTKKPASQSPVASGIIN